MDISLSYHDVYEHITQDKRFTYTRAEIPEIEKLLLEKVKEMTDPDEREFYETVTGGLIWEMGMLLDRNPNMTENVVAIETDRITKQINLEIRIKLAAQGHSFDDF